MGADETATRGTDESVPYDAIFVPAKHYNGTGKPVPYKVRCKTQQRTCVTRNVMVSANVPNRAAAKLGNAPVLRETLWFLPMSRTGQPQYAYW